MGEKVSGYLLLSIGLLIMIICVINIIMVFTNKAKPFSVFNIQSSGSTNTPSLNDLVSQLQKNNPNASSVQLPKLDILSPEVLNQTLNLSTHFFLMSFILGFGYKLASLGVNLVRPINVKLKSHVLEAVNSNDKEVSSNVLPNQLLPQVSSTQETPQPQAAQPTQI